MLGFILQHRSADGGPEPQASGTPGVPEALLHLQRLADLPMGAFLRMRERLNAGAEALDAELRREADDQAICLTGPEFAEGFAAFAEKRKPDFTKAARR